MALTPEQYAILKERINQEVSRRTVGNINNPAMGVGSVNLDRKRSVNTTRVALEKVDGDIPQTETLITAEQGNNLLGRLIKVNTLLDAEYNTEFKRNERIPSAFDFDEMSRFLDQLQSVRPEVPSEETGCKGACVGLCVSSCYALCTGYFTFNINFFSSFFSSFSGDFNGDNASTVRSAPNPNSYVRMASHKTFNSNGVVHQPFNGSSAASFNGSGFSTSFSSNCNSKGFNSRFMYSFSSGFGGNSGGGHSSSNGGGVPAAKSSDFVCDFTGNTAFNAFSADGAAGFTQDFTGDFSGDFVTDFTSNFIENFTNEFSADSFSGDFDSNFAGNFETNTTPGFITNVTDDENQFTTNTAFSGDFSGNTFFSSFSDNVFSSSGPMLFVYNTNG